MIYEFQGIELVLPFSGILSLEELSFRAVINEHPQAVLKLLADEEQIETEIHQLPSDAKVIIKRAEQIIFQGKVTAVNMVFEHALHYLVIEAGGYTIEWDLIKRSRTYCQETMTYEQLQALVTSAYQGSGMIDCVTEGHTIPRFILQYEESDWTFLKRLATHFAACLVPDPSAGTPRAYFGVPDDKNTKSIQQENYSYVRDMKTYLKLRESDRFSPQESTRWTILTEEIFELGDEVLLNRVSSVVTGIFYRVEKGELLTGYELSRRSGLVFFYQNNPRIFGMSLPATVMSRKGCQLRVHFDIDESYQEHADTHYFTYAIESSRIRSIPTEGSKVHIYFPSHVEQEAIAVHAIRAQHIPQQNQSRYLPAPEYKSFSDRNGAQVFFTPEATGMMVGEHQAYVYLSKDGILEVFGKNIVLSSETDILIGGTESSLESVVVGGKTVTLAVGAAGSQKIDLKDNLELISDQINFQASGSGVEPRNPFPDYEQIKQQIMSSDQDMIDDINIHAMETLVARKKAADEKIVAGVLILGEVAILVAISLYCPPASGVAASKMSCAILWISGSGQVAIGASKIQEGYGTNQNILKGSFERGDNYMIDLFEFLGGDEDAYNKFCQINGMVFNLAAAHHLSRLALDKFKPLVTLCGDRAKINRVYHISKNVIRGMIRDLAVDGTIDPARLLCDAALGVIQSSTANLIGGAFAYKLGGSYLATVAATTFTDVLLDWGYYSMNGMEFDWEMSILLNLLANGMTFMIQEPVDAVSGAYYINSDDLVIDAIYTPITLNRSYLSTNKAVGSLGKGWRFSYDSRICFDQENIHLDVPTGHRLIFTPEGEAGNRQWHLKSRGCGWFSLSEKRASDDGTFVLYDHKNHISYHYNKYGLLTEERTAQRQWKKFRYNDDHQLTAICFPGDHQILIGWKDQKISSIKDWIGRTIDYEYRGNYLIKVSHVDHGNCTYSYDQNGFLEQVTDQNGWVYLTNSYDRDGRIIRQELANGEYYEMVHDKYERKVISYYSGRNATEVYQYNKDRLVTLAEFSDGTTEQYQYDDQLGRISYINRRGITTCWEYDSIGRMTREICPDGLVKEWIYDENDDLICERDNCQRETRYEYDREHHWIKQSVKITESRYQVTEKEYDDYGRCLLMTDANGGQTRYEYWGIISAPARIETPMGERTKYYYDKAGRCMEIQNSYGTASFGYNNRNYRALYRNGEGEEHLYLYDRLGRLYSYYPPRSWELKSHAYDFRYDFMARETKRVTPTGDCYEKELNGEGDVLKEIHPNAQIPCAKEKPGIVYDYDGDANWIRIHYPDGGCERRFYDGAGNLIKKVEPESYQPEQDDGAGYLYTYDEQNRLIKVVNPDGVTTDCYEYDCYGNVIREWDDLGREICCQYNGLGNRTHKWERTEEGLYRAVFYEYDNSGNKVKEWYGNELTELRGTPASGHAIRFAYDANHRLTEVADEFGACIRYVYDCLGNVLEERKKIGGTAAGEVWQMIWYRYDKAGRRIEKKERIEGNGTPEFAMTYYEYDKNGNLAVINTPNGHKIIREYDFSDRLISERTIDHNAGIDRTMTFAYDHAQNVIGVTQQGKDGEELTYQYQYDWKNRLISKATPDQGIWEYRYDKNDRLISEAFEEQTILFKSYDRQGNVIRTKNGLDQLVQEMSYDSAKRIKTQQKSGQAQIQISYTADGKQQQIRSGSRVLQESHYEGQGHLTGMTDGNRNETRFETDGWGKITKVIHPDGSEEAYAYNEAGLITDTIDGNGNRISYQYNSFGKVSAITDQLGETEYFYYDKEGNCEKTIDRNGCCVITTYNVDGNILLQRAVDAEGKREVLNRYEYDSLGRLKRATGGGMCYTYEYTRAGRLERKCAGGRTLLAYRYEKDGQLQSLTDVSGKTVFYEYDSLRRLKRLVDEQKQELVSYAYDEQNRLVQTWYGSGITTQYQYDENGNLSHQKTQSETRVFMDYHYQYDGNGNRTEKSGMIWSVDGELQKTSCFRYDPSNQLIEEWDGEQQTCYGYDQARNRIWQEQGEESFVFTYNSRNQLISRKGRTESTFYQYDKQGNLLEELTSEKRKQYQYDAQNRQREVLQADGTFQRNRYDAEGLRAELEENGRLCRFTFHQGEIVSEERDGVAAVSRYLRGHGVEYLEQDEEQFPVLKDDQSSTVFLLDKEHEIQNYYEYDAFGKVKASVGRVENRILYTGQQYDCVAEQYYLRARYYNPVIGRFIQEDPYRGDGLNLYAYCENNPVMYFDPSGYCSEVKFNDGSGNSRGGYDSNGNYVTYIADYFDGVDDGIVRGFDEPTFYAITVPNGGKVYVSTDLIKQKHFADIVDNASGNVIILTGVHGTLEGNLIKELEFYNMDSVKWGEMKNVTVLNINDVSIGNLTSILNQTNGNEVICAWCLSERSVIIKKALGLE